MREVVGFPPNYKDLNARFRVRGKPVIFAWGDTIFNPSRVKITPELMRHEAVHGARQRDMGIENWWADYLDQTIFRFNEELLAHQEEWRARLEAVGHDETYLRAISHRLAGPLYGNICGVATARELITK